MLGLHFLNLQINQRDKSIENIRSHCSQWIRTSIIPVSALLELALGGTARVDSIHKTQSSIFCKASVIVEYTLSRIIVFLAYLSPLWSLWTSHIRNKYKFQLLTALLRIYTMMPQRIFWASMPLNAFVPLIVSFGFEPLIRENDRNFQYQAVLICFGSDYLKWHTNPKLGF